MAAGGALWGGRRRALDLDQGVGRVPGVTRPQLPGQGSGLAEAIS